MKLRRILLNNAEALLDPETQCAALLTNETKFCVIDSHGITGVVDRTSGQKVPLYWAPLKNSDHVVFSALDPFDRRGALLV